MASQASVGLRRPRAWRLPAVVPAGSGVVAAAIALIVCGVTRSSPADAAGLSSGLRGVGISLALFWCCGDALAVTLVPRAWGAATTVASLILGAASSGLVLTALGLVGLPLSLTVWVVLAAGAAASVVARLRRSRARTYPPVTAPVGAPLGRYTLRLAWWATAALLVAIAMIPAMRLGMVTIYGQNPDAHQVAGTAVLFQHVGPTQTDVALPIDVVPPAWRFRYPIFYPLAAVSSLAHLDPITAFPAMVALLLACLGIGFGAFAVLALRAPSWSGPVIAVATAVTMSTLHVVWHPYWNQLWGMALFPWVLLFGWRAVLDGTRGSVVLCLLVLLDLGLAYPLALPYPVLILGALAVAHQRWRSVGRFVRSRSSLTVAAAVVVLVPAIAAALLKLVTGVSQILGASTGLWGGDITRALPMGEFVGPPGGVVAFVVVAGLAGLGLWALARDRSRPPALAPASACALGTVLALLIVLDLRFRLDAKGAYMDFKHLAFIGPLLLCTAAAGLARWASRSRATAVGGLALALLWVGLSAPQARTELRATHLQVEPDLFAIRGWAAALPPGASVRVDIPPSGYQLWGVYMLGSHPVDTPDPVIAATYAYAPWGLRADYVLSDSVMIVAHRLVPYPRPLFAVGRPLFANSEYELWRLRVPPGVAATASQRLVEP